jgi:hypothetical protein
MTQIHRQLATLLCTTFMIAMFSSCDHKIESETTVYPDGSLDKTMMFERNDSIGNLFGIATQNGWRRTVTFLSNDSLSKAKDYRITFSKHFMSVSDANKELGKDVAHPVDTLLHVTAAFSKTFRWFYTYLHYSETYHQINNLRLPIHDYVTPEDLAFIHRLPAEEKKISKADSLQLTFLHEKLYDVYGLAAVSDEYFRIMLNLMRAQNIEKRWEDTLLVHKKKLFERMMHEKDIEADYLPKKMDSLGIPMDYVRAQAEFDSISKSFEKKLGFISNAHDGKYTYIINMPWEVVSNNADSVSGSRLFWNPPAIKFLIEDYTIYAESRKLNYWAIAVSLATIAFTIFLFVRKSKH